MRDSYDAMSAMQEKMRAAADECSAQCASPPQHDPGYPTTANLGCEAGRETFSDRLRSRRGRAERESWKANQIGELLYLLEKNPEVSRILDLIESVGQS